MEYPERLNNHPLKSLVLNVTDACNCACRYCFTCPNPSIMDIDTGIQAINWFVEYNAQKHLDKHEKLSISFFGGEPTLRWDDFMVPIINYVKDYIEPKYKDKFDFLFSCTTNGQLLTEERIQWYRNKRGHFLLSMDGDRDTQEYNRPRIDGKSSFDQVDTIIPILLQYQPDLTFRSTLIPETCDKMIENFLYARGKGFKNYFIIPNVRQDWSEEKIQILQNNMTLICGIMLRDIEEYGSCMTFNWINRMVKAILIKAPQTQHYMRCGLGTTSIGVATDGSLFGCQENSTYHDPDNLFFIGDVWNGLDKERHLQLLQHFDGSRKVFCKNNCENCFLKNICQGWSCPSTNYFMTGDVMERPEMMCRWLQILYLSAANMILNAAENNSQNFIDYMQKNTEYYGGAN